MAPLFFIFAVLAAVIVGILADTANTKDTQQAALIAMLVFTLVSMWLVGLFHAKLWQWALLEGILGMLCVLPLGEGLLRTFGFGEYDEGIIRQRAALAQAFLVVAAIVAFVLFTKQWANIP